MLRQRTQNSQDLVAAEVRGGEVTFLRRMARIESLSEVEALFPRRRSGAPVAAGAAEAGAATFDEQHLILASLLVLAVLSAAAPVEADQDGAEWNINSLKGPEVALHSRTASISNPFSPTTGQSDRQGLREEGFKAGSRNGHLIAFLSDYELPRLWAH